MASNKVLNEIFIWVAIIPANTTLRMVRPRLYLFASQNIVSPISEVWFSRWAMEGTGQKFISKPVGQLWWSFFAKTVNGWKHGDISMVKAINY